MKKVSILLSVYNPNKKYLFKQLESLNNQTYPNIEVIIHDDCPSFRCDKEIFKKYLSNIKYKLLPYLDNNLGFSKSFERLTNSVKHDGYISFCDQDDIWSKNKIDIMVKELEEKNISFGVCDRAVIDENDKIICKSVMHTSNSITGNWNDNSDIVEKTFFASCALGMSVLCTTDFAKRNLPYYEGGHDMWLMCCAAVNNDYTRIDKVLVKYRRHGKNVSGFLPGINSKNDYYEQRVKKNNEFIKLVEKKYPNKINYCNINNFMDARINKKVFKIYKYRYLSSKWALFEIGMTIIPNFIFNKLIKILRKKYR